MATTGAPKFGAGAAGGAHCPPAPKTLAIDTDVAADHWKEYAVVFNTIA